MLQCINQATFSQPENIINNYKVISEELHTRGNNVVPATGNNQEG